jgi:hypothetical protein
VPIAIGSAGCSNCHEHDSRKAHLCAGRPGCPVRLGLGVLCRRAGRYCAQGRTNSCATRVAAKATGADGFIRRWLILEPIGVKGQLTDSAVQTLAKNEYFPNQLTVIPGDGDKVTAGGTELTWHTVDTLRYNVNLYHFAYALEKPTSNVLFWAVTIVNSPRDIAGVRLAIGSNAASVWWVNGKEVIGKRVPTSSAPRL